MDTETSAVWPQTWRYYLTGNVDGMLRLRHDLYKEIASSPRLRRSVFADQSEELRARAVAASLFILMLEKTKAADMLAPCVDSTHYPGEDFVKSDAIEKLERQTRRTKDPLAAVAVGSILAQTASFCYRCFLRDFRSGLRLAEKAEELFAATETYYKQYYTTQPDLYLPFLLARHENFLHLSLFEWRAGKQKQAKERLEEQSLIVLTVAYTDYLALDPPKAGAVEMISTQTLGTLAERLRIEGKTAEARACIYRALQTVPRTTFQESVPGRSVDTCRRGYAFIQAARIESGHTTTDYRHAIALTRNAEWCFEDLAKFLKEKDQNGTVHAWRLRALIQRLQCCWKAEADRHQEISALRDEIRKEVKKIPDCEEQEFAKGQFALTKTWMLEHDAENAPVEEREQKWRECLSEANKISESAHIPGRLRREGWLHQGKAKLQLAMCLRQKVADLRADHSHDDSLLQKCQQYEQEYHHYEDEGKKLLWGAIKDAEERYRPKIQAAGHIALAKGLASIDPSAAIDSFNIAERLLEEARKKNATSTFLEKQLKELRQRPLHAVTADGIVRLPLSLDFKALRHALEATYFDYYEQKAVQEKLSANRASIQEIFCRLTGWERKQYYRIKTVVQNTRKGILRERKLRKKRR